MGNYKKLETDSEIRKISMKINVGVKENVQTFTEFCQKFTKKFNFNRTISHPDRFRTYGPHQCGANSQIYQHFHYFILNHTKCFS